MRASRIATLVTVAGASLITPLLAQDLPSTPQAVRQRLAADFYRKPVVLRRSLYSIETPAAIGITTTSPNHGVVYQVDVTAPRRHDRDIDVRQLFNRLTAVEPTWRLVEYPPGTRFEVGPVEFVNGDLRLPLFRDRDAGQSADTTLTVFWGIASPSDADTYLGIERLVSEFLTIARD